MELTPNYNSFAPITREDHAGYLWVAAMYCIITSGLVFFTRVWIKQNNFGHDDSVFAAATVILGGINPLRRVADREFRQLKSDKLLLSLWH